MSADELLRFDELVSRYLDDELIEADTKELVALIAQPSLAARFLEMTRVNSEIAGLLAAPVPDEAMVELIRIDIEKSLSSVPREKREPRLRVVERGQPSVGAEAPTLRSASGKSRPAWPRLAWAASFVILAALAAVLFFYRMRVDESPVVVSAQGEVRLVGPDGDRAPNDGDSWKHDEKLETVGPNSGVTLKFRDGSRFDLSDNAIAVKKSSKQECRVTLEHGVIQADVKKQSARSPFIFATAEAEATVVGTRLRLLATRHSTRLEVSEGEVRFRRLHDRREITLRSGEYAVVAPNVPFAARPIHSDPNHGK